jgi:hypothetical protein
MLAVISGRVPSLLPSRNVAPPPEFVAFRETLPPPEFVCLSRNVAHVTMQLHVLPPRAVYTSDAFVQVFPRASRGGALGGLTAVDTRVDELFWTRVYR